MKIRYEPIEIKEPHWGRWLLGTLASVAVLVGVIGWYLYFMASPAPGTPPAVARSVETREQASAVERATHPFDRPASTQASTEAAVSSLPESFSATELQALLRSHPEGPQAFERHYRDREVTWSGVVTSTSRVDDVLGVELKDSDGVRVLAWCAADADVPSGANVTVRGRLTRERPDGFVLDQCALVSDPSSDRRR